MGEPLTANHLERIGRPLHLGCFLHLSINRRINAIGQQAARIIPPLAGILQPNIGVDAKG